MFLKEIFLDFQHNDVRTIFNLRLNNLLGSNYRQVHNSIYKHLPENGNIICRSATRSRDLQEYFREKVNISFFTFISAYLDFSSEIVLIPPREKNLFGKFRQQEDGTKQNKKEGRNQIDGNE